MPTFAIERYELWTSIFHVEAASEADAIMKLIEEGGESVDDTSELIEVADKYGMPIGQNSHNFALFEELKKRGLPMDGMVIPSIRAIEEV